LPGIISIKAPAAASVCVIEASFPKALATLAESIPFNGKITFGSGGSSNIVCASSSKHASMASLLSNTASSTGTAGLLSCSRS
jgi:hypothetical protein